MNETKFLREIKIGQYNATIRPFTLEEYHAIIIAKTKENFDSFLLNLTRRCILEANFDLDTISKAYGELLFLHLWVYSLNQEDTTKFNIDVVCESCTSVNRAIVDLNQSYIHQEDQKTDPLYDFYDYVYPLTEASDVLLKKPTLFNDKNKINMVVTSIVGVLVKEPTGGHTVMRLCDMTSDDEGALMQLLNIDHIKNIYDLIGSEKCVSLGIIQNTCTCGDNSTIKPLVGVKDIIKGMGENLNE